MIEQNIIEWIELDDSIQKLDLYNKRGLSFLTINYLLSQYNNFSEFFYFIIVILFFLQIIELNIAKIDLTEDNFLKVVKFFERIFLFHKLIKNNNTAYIILLIIIIIFFLSSIIFSLLSSVLYLKKKKKYEIILIYISLLNTINIFFTNGPAIHILLYKFFCLDNSKIKLSPIEGFWKIASKILSCIFIIIILLNVIINTKYYNNIGTLNGNNTRSKINDRFFSLIVILKIFYFIFNYFIELSDTDNKIIILIYNAFILLFNLIISLYTYKILYYYNHIINAYFHYGCHFTTWTSLCIFLKNLIKIKDITLFIIFGIVLITIGLFFHNKYIYFKVITEFNIFKKNNLINIEKYNHVLLDLLYNNTKNNQSHFLIAGVIKRFEEYISNNPELYDQYNKLLNNNHLQNNFSSKNELKILSIILINYSYNIEKSRNITDLTLNFCYFLINEFKNPVYAIWLCTKLRTNDKIHIYYKYVLMEEIKDYLINFLENNPKSICIKNIEISNCILFNQYMNLFKIKIYDSICTHIEYYDIFRNKIATKATIDNYLRVGEEVLCLRKDVLILWDKILLLNPFCDESKDDFLLYSNSIIQDNSFVQKEEKRYKELRLEKISEKDNLYFSMFNPEISSILLSDGYSFNGKIVYRSHNFPYLFMFNEKELINITIDELIPDVIQNFHKNLIENALKYSNISYLFKNQRNSLLKGKNDFIFDIKIYVRPVPNLCYGLLFFIYLQKIKSEQLTIILDKNLYVNGFTKPTEEGTNLIYDNYYNLSNDINGNHIGLIIPEIFLYLNYNDKDNNFYFIKNNIDLKGNIYQINDFNGMEEKVDEILEELKKIQINKNEIQNKIEKLEKYDELIMELNKQKIKNYSIFFRIEEHSFIDKKYIYYLIYITNDIIFENEDSLKNIINNDSFINEKIFRLSSKSSKRINNKLIKRELIPIENKNDLSNQINSNNNKKENSKIDLQSNEEPLVFYKIRKHILKKNDCSHVKKMRYLSYIFVCINIILIASDFTYINNIIDKSIKYLKENKYFTHVKICIGNIYISAVNLRLVYKGYIPSEICPNSNCTKFYLDILKNCIDEISQDEINIYYYFKDYRNILYKKLEIKLISYNISETNNLSLDMNNLLYLIISQGMKVISQIEENCFDNTFFDIYFLNLLNNCLTYFYSLKFDSYSGSEKEQKYHKISFHIPLCFAIYGIYLIYTLYIYYSYIILIKDIHIYYFDKLMNFQSEKFEKYLQKMNEIKKKFGKVNNEENEEENNEQKSDEFDFEEKNNEKNNENNKKKNKISKKKKQTEILQQKIKNKKIISDYLCKLNTILILKFLCIFLISTLYYISSILFTIRIKDNYLEFDYNLQIINKLYLDYYKIFLIFQEKIENFERMGNISYYEILDYATIERPDFGNSLIFFQTNSKYSSKNLKMFNEIYNHNTCQILENNSSNKICEKLFSSALTNGLDQAISQINNIIISNIVDELNSLNKNRTLNDIFQKNTALSDFEIFMGYYMYLSFLKTENIFEEFRKDEEKYMQNTNKYFLVLFFIVYFILFIFLLKYVYSYKDFTGYFLCFIGIIPPKYLADDDEFYKQVLGLEPFYY